MAATSTARVTYRSLELAPAATVSERSGGLRFIALDTPPPVRTVLGLAEGSAAPLAVEVVEAIEVEAPGVVRGCVVREVDRALLQQPVGSERLASGAAGGEVSSAREPGSASSDDGNDPEGSYAAAMAVPAPVVGDISEAIDVDGRGDDEGDDGDDANDANDANGEANSEANSEGGPARAKKRRGRKRK